ncbi:MAG: 16S rRNA (adenine(1518)-N(6)/adenine(1519)-N(6))-dimethyltransferase RsmA [Zoogloeaceae bacterium]|nr:16S rRNA (adenine(1518)-N(6)/adenine(1519)-N(6))-dimethyltransferase RsmA [Zoogloeaceae bacterium]
MFLLNAHRPRKRFGQNFLKDAGVCRAIVEAVAPLAGDCLVEIGPGLGALTGLLLQRLDHLHVVEIDRDLAARLEARYPPKRLAVHTQDALSFDFGQLASPGFRLRIVGNLPYNISTPLLFHLAHFADSVADMHFMLQKEVVARMRAEPGGAEYGRLSVMLQYRFRVEELFTVAPECFDPVPKVDSAVVRLLPKSVGVAGESTAISPEDFALVVAAAFGQRRKMLRNTLAPFFTESELEELGISPAWRAQNLSLADFVRLSNHLSRRGNLASNEP